MPMYEYECQVCGARAEARRCISDRRCGPVCCSSTMEQRIFSAQRAIVPEWDVNYRCVATGQNVTSQRQRKRLMKEHGLVDAREFPAPDWGEAEVKREEFHQVANTPLPKDLQVAMKREGLDSLPMV